MTEAQTRSIVGEDSFVIAIVGSKLSGQRLHLFDGGVGANLFWSQGITDMAFTLNIGETGWTVKFGGIKEKGSVEGS